MTQAPLLVALHLVGMCVVFAFGPRRYAWLCASLAFAVGMATMVVVSLFVLCLGMYRPWSVALGAALVVALCIAHMWRQPKGLDRRTLFVATCATLAFSAVALVLSYPNLAITSSDSFYIVTLAKVLGHDGAFDARSLSELQKWGVFVVLAHSWSMFTLQDFLYSLQTVLGASFLPVFALALWHAIDALPGDGAPRAGLRVAVIALLSAALYSCAVFAFHLFFLHQNLGTAVYLFAFVVLFWVAEQRQDASCLPIAFLCLLSVSLHRTETPIVAAIALVATVLRSELPRRTITRPLATLTIVFIAWFLYLTPHLPEEGPFLTRTRAMLATAPLLAFFAWWLLAGSKHSFIQLIHRRAQAIVAFASLVVVAAMFAHKSDHMLSSLDAWMTNLFRAPLWWGYAWYGIVALAAIAALIQPPPAHRAFTFTIWLTFAFVMMVVYPRIPYRIAMVDSANRMMVHVLPLIFFYLGLKTVPALWSQPARPAI